MLKPIKDFDGYFISNNGKVYCNLGRGNRRKTDRTVDLYEVAPRPGKTGYMRVFMRNTVTNKRVDKYIHRLVAEYFIPNPKGKRCVNHKDCNRANNAWYNLEWVNHAENTKQTEELGHVVRNEKGQFVGNFDYSRYSLLPSEERKNIARYVFVKACQSTPKGGV